MNREINEARMAEMVRASMERARAHQRTHHAPRQEQPALTEDQQRHQDAVRAKDQIIIALTDQLRLAEIDQRLQEVRDELGGGEIVRQSEGYIGYNDSYLQCWSAQGLVHIEDLRGGRNGIEITGIGIGAYFDGSQTGELSRGFYLRLSTGEITEEKPSNKERIINRFKYKIVKAQIHSHGDFIDHHGAEEAFRDRTKLVRAFDLGWRKRQDRRPMSINDTAQNRRSVIELVAHGFNILDQGQNGGGHH
jgi:hypothetical protein